MTISNLTSERNLLVSASPWSVKYRGEKSEKLRLCSLLSTVYDEMTYSEDRYCEYVSCAMTSWPILDFSRNTQMESMFLDCMISF